MVARDELSALLARVSDFRDRAAFNALYSAAAPQLFGVVLRILHRRDVAEEVLQETFLKIWERAGDYDAGRAGPMTWMATIARNRAIDIARRRQPASTEDVDGLDDIPVDAPDALAQVETRQDLRRLQACLEGIGIERREMVLLAYRDGLSREDLAVRYRVPANTIRTWLHRSLKQLRDCMGS